MLELLESLESGLYCPVGASDKLRDQIVRIDGSVQVQKHLHSSSPGAVPIPSALTYGPSPPDSSSSTLVSSPYSSAEAQFMISAELFRYWPWV